LKEIPHDADECPFSEGNPQIKFKEQFASFTREQKKNVLKSVIKLQEPTEEHGEKAGELHPCPSCGYPTISSKACVFCTIMQEKSC
jgi:hypothetical protein